MSTAASVPPLYPGVRLTREEFLRRWDHLPGLKHAELIDGLVYMPSPVSFLHGRYDSLMHTLLGDYEDETPGCESVINTSWLMMGDVPQPDEALRIKPEYGGQSSLNENQYCVGAPELIVEISQSSAMIDLGPKLALYQAAGVQEYLVVLAAEQRIIWRRLAGRQFEIVEPDRDGTYRSQTFPGLWIDTEAIGLIDRRRARATLHRGLQTPEHAAFVRRLESQR